MTTDLALRTEAAKAAIDPYAPTNHDEARSQAQIVAESQMYGLTKPAQAYVVLMTGHDLGLSPSQALRGVHVIKGKPSPSADTLHAVVLNSPLCEYFRHVETTDDHSTWVTKRVGEPEERGTYTLKEAEAAGLLKDNGNWKKHPRRMLKARAKAFLARDVYPDLCLGLYTPDELGESHGTVEYTTAVDLPTELQPVDPNPWPDRMKAMVDAGNYSGAKQLGRDVGDEGLALYAELRSCV